MNTSINQSLFSFLNNLAFQSDAFDTAVIFFAGSLIELLVLVVLILIVFSLWRGKLGDVRRLFLILVATFIAWGLSQLINFLFPSPRPFLELDTVKSLFLHGGMDSFPSGHATIASALAVGLLYYKKSFSWLYVVGAILVGLSRVVAGVHWPLDILGGFLLGGGVVVLLFLLYEKLQAPSLRDPF